MGIPASLAYLVIPWDECRMVNKKEPESLDRLLQGCTEKY